MIDEKRLAALRDLNRVWGRLVERDASEVLDTIEALWKENAELKKKNDLYSGDTFEKLEAVARAAEEMEDEMVVSDGLHDALKSLREGKP